MVSAVEKHYNERARYGKSDGCAPLRGLLNAVKNTEIVRAPVPCKERRKHITLVGAGHGAQIQFLQQNKFTDVDAYDVSRVALETLHDRAAAGMVVNLHHCDFTQPLPVDQEHKPASLVEAGLCLHYGASSEQCMRQLVSNLQSLVALNGRLIVTIPNSQFIIFCFRVQWVRVWSGRSWDDAFSALVKCENNCVRAVQSLGGFQPPTNIEDCVPAEFVDKLSGSGDGTLPHRILLERAMGVVDIPKCCTLVAQFRVTLETPPTLGPDEFGKTYFFRLHSSVNENTFCPEPFVPASAWDMFAAAGFRACSGYQDVLAWLKHRQNSSNEQIYRALGASPIDSTVETAMMMYACVVFERYTAAQPSCVSNTPIWKHLYTRGRRPCVKDGLVCWEAPLCGAEKGKKWCSTGKFIEEQDDEEDGKTFKLTAEAVQEMKRRRVSRVS